MENLKRLQRQPFKDMYSNENMAYPDADYTLDSYQSAAEEGSMFGAQQLPETSKFLSNLRQNQHDMPLNDEENNDSENDLENIESDSVNCQSSVDFKKFPKISATDNNRNSLNYKISKSKNKKQQAKLNRNYFKGKYSTGTQQFGDSFNTDLSGCQQCSSQKTGCTNDRNTMFNKTISEVNTDTFNNDKDFKGFKIHKSPKKGVANGAGMFVEGDIGRNDDDDDDDDWTLLKFSVSNDKDNENWYPHSLNDQLDSSRNTLSHEADYKLSKMEQDSAEKKNNTSWNWGIFKRSHPFNPMRLIKLKTSERLMKKGFSASLPSSSLEPLQSDYRKEFVEIQNFAKEPLDNDNDYGLRKDIETERYKRGKEITNRFALKPVNKENSNSSKTQNQTIVAFKDNQLKGYEAQSNLQDLETNNDQKDLKVLETSKEMVNVDKNLKPFNEIYDNNEAHNRRKRSISSETKTNKAIQKQNLKALKLNKLWKTLNIKQQQNNLNQRFKVKQKILKNLKKFDLKTKPTLKTNRFKKLLSLRKSSVNLRKSKEQQGQMKLSNSRQSFSKACLESNELTKKAANNLVKNISENKAFFNESFENKNQAPNKSSKGNFKTIKFQKNLIKDRISFKSRNKYFQKRQLFNKGPKKLENRKRNLKKNYYNNSYDNNVNTKKIFEKGLQTFHKTNKTNNSNKRAKRSLNPFLYENDFQTNLFKNRNRKRFSSYFADSNKTQTALNSTAKQPKNDFGLYANDKPLKQIEKNSYKKYENNARRQQDSKNSKTKNFYENPQNSYEKQVENQKLPDTAKMYAKPLDFTYSDDPPVVEVLKNRYLNDLKNFNQNYKFNDNAIDWSGPYLRKPNDNKQDNNQDSTLNLTLRNEILNCQAFSNLEEFLKSLQQNLTQPLKANNTSTDKVQGQVSTSCATNSTSTNEDTFTYNYNTSATTEASVTEPTEAYKRPTTCFPVEVMEETTESFTPYPLDNCEDSTDSDSETETEGEYLEDATDSRDLKLNISINAKVHGNPLAKDFYGNGSIEMLPGLMDDRQRREILWRLPQQYQKRKCAQMPTVKSNSLEDSGDLSDLASGKLSSEIVQNIFKAVKNEPSFNDLPISLKLPEVTNRTDTSSNFNALKNQNNEDEVRHAEQLFAQAMSSINSLIEKQLQSQACIKLRPDLQQFYDFILRNRQEQDKARAKRDMTRKLKRQEKSSTIKKLLKEYEALPEQEQKEMLAVKDELLKSLSDLKAKRELKFDVSHVDAKETLQNNYTQAFLKLLKAANFYRASSNKAEPTI